MQTALRLLPRLAAVAFIAIAGATTTGCVATVSSEPATVETYTPVYYNGYVVYYDDSGRPYYYADGLAYYVPQSYVHFDVLVDNYRVHRPAYYHWYRRSPPRYRATPVYRARPAYRTDRVYRAAPAHRAPPAYRSDRVYRAAPAHRSEPSRARPAPAYRPEPHRAPPARDGVPRRH